MEVTKTITTNTTETASTPNPNSCKKTKKCHFCKKKTVILIECSYCNSMVCLKHRGPETHNCQYNFKNTFSLPEKYQMPKVEAI